MCNLPCFTSHNYMLIQISIKNSFLGYHTDVRKIKQLHSSTKEWAQCVDILYNSYIGCKPCMTKIVSKLLHSFQEHRNAGYRSVQRCGVDGAWWIPTFFIFLCAAPQSIRKLILEIFFADRNKYCSSQLELGKSDAGIFSSYLPTVLRVA